MKKEKRGFNLSNKLAYTLIAVVVLVFLGMGVYAIVVPGTSGNPGHSIQSIGAPAGCTPGQFLRLALDGTWGCSPTSCNAGQVLTYNGDATWSCTTPATGGTYINVFNLSSSWTVSAGGYTSACYAACPASNPTFISGSCYVSKSLSGMATPALSSSSINFQTDNAAIYGLKGVVCGAISLNPRVNAQYPDAIACQVMCK